MGVEGAVVMGMDIAGCNGDHEMRSVPISWYCV